MQQDQALIRLRNKMENEAIVVGKNLQFSTKQAIEISNFIRGRGFDSVKKDLMLVLEEKKAVPVKRFTNGAGHKKGKIGPGKYPHKATKEILNLLNSLGHNAENKGLNLDELYIKRIMPSRAGNFPKYGRLRGRRRKMTHITIVAGEKKENKKVKKAEK